LKFFLKKSALFCLPSPAPFKDKITRKKDDLEAGGGAGKKPFEVRKPLFWTKKRAEFSCRAMQEFYARVERAVWPTRRIPDANARLKAML